MKTVIRIYTPVENDHYPHVYLKDAPLYSIVLMAFVTLNVLLGVMSDPIVALIRKGLGMFS
jgi:hypothetical protein